MKIVQYFVHRNKPLIVHIEYSLINPKGRYILPKGAFIRGKKKSKKYIFSYRFQPPKLYFGGFFLYQKLTLVLFRPIQAYLKDNVIGMLCIIKMGGH